MVGRVSYDNEEELAELKQILFGSREFILVNEHPVDGVLDLTEENVIFL